MSIWSIFCRLSQSRGHFSVAFRGFLLQKRKKTSLFGFILIRKGNFLARGVQHMNCPTNLIVPRRQLP